MKRFDVCVIGGGLLGCFAARNLCRYSLSVCLIESREDVCTGISRANAAIVYAGYDNRPGSYKASVTLKANSDFDALCEELDVPFRRCGSLMTACGEASENVIRRKYSQGLENGVPGIALLNRSAALELEPGLGADVTMALYAPGTGTVNPWELCFGAYENALANGCEAVLNSAVEEIERSDDGYILHTANETIICRGVVNCAGLNADRIRELLFEPEFRLERDYVDFIVTDRSYKSTPSHIIMEETENGKGITAVPTVQGNMLIESMTRCNGRGYDTDSANVLRTLRRAEALLPGTQEAGIVRSFASVRPLVRHVTMGAEGYVCDGRDIGSFVIDRPEPGFISFIGIKSPGLTCADELTRSAAADMADYLGADISVCFTPVRQGIMKVHGMSCRARGDAVENNPEYGEIVCRCCDISRGEIRAAVKRGAVTVAGVKRRAGAMLGICQGGRCEADIAEIIASECGVSPDEVMQDGPDRHIYGGVNGTL